MKRDWRPRPGKAPARSRRRDDARAGTKPRASGSGPGLLWDPDVIARLGLSSALPCPLLTLSW